MLVIVAIGESKIARLPPIWQVLKTWFEARVSWSKKFGAIAQLGERIVRNDEAEGASPSGSTRQLAVIV